MLKDEIKKVLEELYDEGILHTTLVKKKYVSQALTRILELVGKGKGEKK